MSYTYMPVLVGPAVAGLVAGVLLHLPPTSQHVRLDGPPPKACQNVILEDAESGYVFLENAVGLSVHARRLSNWDDKELPNGKWVGVIGRSSIDMYSTPSAFFPGIRKGGRGCIHFRDHTGTDDSPRAASAELVRRDGYPLHKYAGAIICEHQGGHGSDPVPRRESAANNCGTGAHVTLSYKGTRFRGLDIDFEVKESGFNASLEEAMRNRVIPLNTEEVDTLVKILEIPGPWFPCSQTGCCRPLD